MSSVRRRRWAEPALLVLLFAVALAVRLYGLHNWPPGLHNDEAANGIDAMGVLQGRWPIFFAKNNGREPLFIYLQALSIGLLGPNAYALRVPAAVCGALTVPAAYWMTREAFAKTAVPARWVALWTALFLAFSYWHVSLSRVGFRAIMLPLVAALAFGWFWRAWGRLDCSESGEEEQDSCRLPLLDLVLCGAFVGLSLYTYTAARFVPLVIVTVALAGAALSSSALYAKRAGLALGVILVTALVVFVPLGFYFFSHPGSFLGRAATVSVLSADDGTAGPLQELGKSVVQTVKMFFVTPDPNPRHNPAQRPVFDLLMSMWLVSGLAVAVLRWRVLPYFFTIAWLLFLILPAVLTSEGVPHSLRAIGILLPTVLLAVLGMQATAERLARRWWTLTLWLPLPFLLLSGYTGLRDYFQSWEDVDRFRDAFRTEFSGMANLMATASAPDTVWIISISPNYFVAYDEFYPTLSFYVTDQYGSVVADEQTAPVELAQVTRGYRHGFIVSPDDMSDRPDTAYVFGDPRHLLDFLLRKHGRLVSDVEKGDSRIAYKVYELPTKAEYQVAEKFAPMDAIFDGKLKLTEAAYGQTALDLDEDPSALESKMLPSGHPLWAALHWKALSPIDVDLKASLYLKDETGNIAGQVDDLLVGDGYPLRRVWEPAETAGSYHIIPTLPAIPPARYSLLVRVYEDQTLRPLPVLNQAGEIQGVDVLLGYVDVVRPVSPPVIAPETAMPAETRLGPDLLLLGYDLSHREVRPGGSLPLTLYWQARSQPTRNYVLHIELRDNHGTPVAYGETGTIDGMISSTSWQEGDAIRDWQRLAVPATTPAGTYELFVAVGNGRQSLAEASLGQVAVAGRPRYFESPSLALPVEATFGNQVALLGVVTPDAFDAMPGDVVNMAVAWQALSPTAADIVRFVHVLDFNGKPVAQHDSVPCGGECPSSSWLPGEVLFDEISLQLPLDLPPGSYPIGLGWYDPATLQRAPASDANGQRLKDDLMPLPLILSVAPP